MAVRAIGKAVETFKRDKRVCPVFRPDGAMTYDERLLGWKGPAHVSVLTLHGREIVAMVYGEYQAGYLASTQGTSGPGVPREHLLSRMPPSMFLKIRRFSPHTFWVWIWASSILPWIRRVGGTVGTPLSVVRQRCAAHRRTFQATGTKAAKRRLKKLAGRESRFRRCGKSRHCETSCGAS